MARRRARSLPQKLKRMSKDRLDTLRSKVDELNIIKRHRAILIWTEEGRTLAFGDEQLLEHFSCDVQVPNPVRRPTLPPTDSLSTAASPDRESQCAQKIFDDEAFSQDLPHEKELPALTPTDSLSSAASPSEESHCVQEVFEDGVLGQDLPREDETPVVRMRWRKEDLDFLAVDFF